MTQFTKCFSFNLSDTLTGNVEFLTYFFQSSCPAVIQAKTESQYFLLSVCQCIQHFYQLLF